MMSEKFNHLESAIAHKTTATELVINYRETRDLEISKILKLDKLEKLSLRYLPSHYFFPKQIYELKSLKSLTLSECSFGKIPDGISAAKNLKELKLVNYGKWTTCNLEEQR
jgi:Leucine-rich repeat (LRR) protein